MTGRAEESEAGALARVALAGWGGAATPPRLVQIRENAVFEVVLAQGVRVALRLHRPGYQGRRAILVELDFMRALAAAGLPVPEPWPMADGGLIGEAGGRLASCVTWIEGRAIGAAGVPLAGGVAEQEALFAAIGGLLARLHDAADGWAGAAGLARRHWDAAGLLGETPHWGRFWENPALSRPGRDLVREAARLARDRLGLIRREAPDYGLIHADVYRENVLCGGSGLALIDFDDCGHGYRLYDLATALVQSLDEPHLARIVPALLAGYRAVRPLPAEAARDLPLFVMLRTFASAGWIMTRAGADDPRQRAYADRASRMARAVLAGRAPWDVEA